MSKSKAPKRRNAGIRRLPDGRLEVRATYVDPKTGKRRDRTRYLPPEATDAVALALKAQLLTELQAGDVRDRPQRMTVRDYSLRWAEAKSGRLRSSVQHAYASAIAERILPQLGDLEMTAVTREDVERWAAWAEKAKMPAEPGRSGKPYAKDTVLGWWRVLRQLLRDAAADLRFPDPTYRVRAPAPDTEVVRETRTLTAAELGRFLAAAAQSLPERHAELATLAYTGIRPGELYELRWTDLDLGQGRFSVQRSVWRGAVASTPKNKKPREIAVPAALGEVLLAHRRWLIKEQHKGLETGLVFPSDVATHRSPSSLTKTFNHARAVAKIQQRVNPQVLRRTFNSLLLAAGVDRIVLRSQMGHSSEEMTERYAGVDIELKRSAVEHLAKLVTGG